MVIVLDMSVPNELYLTLETLLTVARERIKSVVSEPVRKKLTAAAWERVGSDHLVIQCILEITQKVWHWLNFIVVYFLVVIKIQHYNGHQLYAFVFLHTRVASHLARSDTPSITCVVARLSRSDPSHYYDTPPTNGKALRVSLTDPNCQP